MCGIAGYIGPTPPNAARMGACEFLMGRRGPDAKGRYERRLADNLSVTLLHSRLSIIDLDPRANQPMRHGHHVIACNGEVYNYRELADALRGEGTSFVTSGDTEVLIAAIARWGLARALDRAEGMWAFAAVDEAASTATLSRDRFGEKPLYLMDADGGLYFASEVKFLFALSGRAPRADREHLKRFLVNGYKALHKVPATFHEGVRELAAGTALTISPEGRTETRYWTPGFTTDETLSFEDSVAATRDALIEAVGLRLRADVPLAFCLSGGVDSNAIISIARRVFDHDVHGFTIVNTDARYDEEDLVKASVAELGLRHTSVRLTTANFLDNLDTLVRQHDAPVFTLSYYVHWLLMQAISDAGYKVSISGTGADELFTGYYDHQNAYLYEVRNDAVRAASARAEWQAHVAPVVRNPFLQDPDLFVNDPAFRGHIYLGAEEFSAGLTAPWSEPFTETRYCEGLLRNRMANEMFHEAVPVILHEDDLNAMYFSIENRSPFLDRKLFDTAASIPTRHMVRDGKAKAVLREAVRGIAPDAIVDERRKVGFNAPIGDLLDTNDPEVRARLLDDGPVFDIVRRETVERLMDSGTLPNSESKFLFNILGVRLFLENVAQDAANDASAQGAAA